VIPASELVTRALSEDSTKEVLQVLQARNAAWGRKEDHERRQQQEESRHGPPLFLDPAKRAVGNALLGLVAQDEANEPLGWERADMLRSARDVLDTELRRVIQADKGGGQRVTLAEAAEASGLSTATLSEHLRDGSLRGHKVPSETNPRTNRWDVSPEDLEEFCQRREQGELGPPQYNVHYVLPDLGEAIRSGELASFHPNDVAEFVRRKRAEALAVQGGYY
jgi:hypothetical protein